MSGTTVSRAVRRVFLILGALWLPAAIDLLPLARAETFELIFYAYCPVAGNYCGHGSKQAYRKYMKTAVQELNTVWEVTGISFKPVIIDPASVSPPGAPNYSFGVCEDDPDTTYDELGPFQHWRQNVAALNPHSISVMLTLQEGMSCSQLPINPGQPWYEHYGIRAWAGAGDPILLGKVLAHELGHHFCLCHIFGWNESTGSFMDTADTSSADGGLDWDGDDDDLCQVSDTSPDPGFFEALDPDGDGDPNPGADIAEPSHTFVEGHEWCGTTVNDGPGAVDPGSPHDAYCDLHCFRYEDGQLQNASFPVIASTPPQATTMSYHDAACVGPYVRNGVRIEGIPNLPGGSVDHIRWCQQTYRTDLWDACLYAGGDTDHDGVCDSADNCKTVKNTDQKNADYDPLGNACDPDPFDAVYSLDPNDPVTDGDGDLAASLVDLDSDGDHCPNLVDQHPDKASVVIGSHFESQCSYGIEVTYGFEGNDSDGDGVRDCEDYDDDNDGVCDGGGPFPATQPGVLPGGCARGPLGYDVCPTMTGTACNQQGISVPCPKNWMTCQGSGCAEFVLILVDVENPINRFTFDWIRIVNRTLYIRPPAGRTLSETAKILQGSFFPPSPILPAGSHGQQPGPLRVAPDTAPTQATGPLRLEIWRRGGTAPIATVAEYPIDAVIEEESRFGSFLAVTPSEDALGAPLTVGGTFAVGLLPGGQPPRDTDGDGWPDGLDDCLEGANASQSDADSDGFGDACDADLDGDLMVTPADLDAVTACDGADLALAMPLSEPAYLKGFARPGPDPGALARARSCVVSDLDENGIVNVEDSVRVESALGRPPGPSALKPQENLCDPGACDDGDPCSVDQCEPATGRCLHLPLACDDGDPCTVDLCAPGSGACSHGPAVCDDGNACTVDACNPDDGSCGSLPAADGLACDDGNACTERDACSSGFCSGAPGGSCEDGDFCTQDQCDPATGLCTHTAFDCNDGNPCTLDACEPASGICRNQPMNAGDACDDGNACTSGERCDATGQCQPASTVTCAPDADQCTIESCDRVSGQCVPRPRLCVADNLCVQASCDSAIGCVVQPILPADPGPMSFLDSVTLSWAAPHPGTRVNTYRDTIPPGLLGTRRPPPYHEVCFESADLGGDGTDRSTDFGFPPLGQAYYYLITAEAACGETPPGADSAGVPRPLPSPCRTPP